MTPAKKTTTRAASTKGTAKSPAKNVTKGTAKGPTTGATKSPTKTTTKPASARSRSSVAAAAERAGGERARRRATPLLTGPSAGSAAASGAPTTSMASSKAGSTTGAAESTGGRPRRSTRPTTRRTPPKASKPTLRVVPDPEATPPTTQRSPSEPSPQSGQAVAPGVAEIASVLLSTGQLASRTLGQAAGAAAGQEWERRLAETLDFLRRRVAGDYAVDDFGFDEDFTTHTVFPVLRLLKDKWFRVEVRGIENIPAEGGALLVSNHSGTVAIDSIITQLAIYDAHPQQRFLRMLGADFVFQLPVVGDMARKTGATLATNPDAERLMRGGALTGVWPEGFKGVGKPFRERYKLQRFGRGGFVSAAIRSEVPIIPCSVVGAEESYPMIGNIKPLARLLGAPYAPVTPFFPLLGPLGLIPLPSKWIIQFGPPVDTASLGPEAAEDPMLVFDLTDQVRETIQQTLYSVLVTRRSVFF